MSDKPVSELQQQRCLDLAEYERALRAMPSYELKAEYITRIGTGWDSLPRPRQESAIAALLEVRARQSVG
jgi:hypothetical protein